MSGQGSGSCFEFPGAGVPGAGQDDLATVMRLIGRAVLGAMVEDWTLESLELHQRMSAAGSLPELPDDTILWGSAMERGLMQQLVGEGYPLGRLPSRIREFMALVVAGSRVAEDEIYGCRVVWVARGKLAEPVFVLNREE